MACPRRSCQLRRWTHRVSGLLDRAIVPSGFIVVLTTLPSRAKARQLARLILSQKLAACVNLLGPAESFFWWQGKIDHAKEFLLIIKTRTSRFSLLRRFLEKHHPYDVPEIISLIIRDGNDAYLQWLKVSTP
ncbi:MAG: divalent-cation tolerance protein CutA [Candidatus Omnitrophica bacterium]|nr:divalent-cation tolerance protein CutA [Candidatus Omnitrophota bacterium]